MKRQQIIILIGTILVAVMVLFPPHLGVEQAYTFNARTGEFSYRLKQRRFIGYYCIFSPLEERVISQKLYKERDFKPSNNIFTAQIDAQRLAIQIFALILVTTGLAFAFKQPRSP